MRVVIRTAVGIGAAALALSGCTTDPEPRSAPADPAPAVVAAASPRSVGPAEFARGIAEPDRVTINVHIPYEGEIDGTDLEIPYNLIGERAAELPQDRSTPLAVYCRSGPMSRTAMAELSRLGFTDVIELDGGMRAWTADGRALRHR